MTPKKSRPEPTLRQRALDLLGRREYSARELARRLAAFGHDMDEIESIVTNFEQKGWLSDETMSYVESEGLSGRVNFTGYVTDDDLRALYSCCTVCVYPSLYEGFGLPPLEAMACGAPVIASNDPSLAEAVRQAALTVPPTDVQGLAQGLVDMIRDEGKRTHFARAGLEHAAQFSWERTARLTLEVYRDTKKHKP